VLKDVPVIRRVRLALGNVGRKEKKKLLGNEHRKNPTPFCIICPRRRYISIDGLTVNEPFRAELNREKKKASSRGCAEISP
jgi:hypothetical protein